MCLICNAGSTRLELRSIACTRNILKRVQVKYGDGKSSNSQGAIVVKLDYENRRKDNFTYKSSEVDLLVVYIPKIDKLCSFPLEIFEGKRKLTIRIEKPKINLVKGIIFAKDYYW